MNGVIITGMSQQTMERLRALYAEARRLHDEAWARLRQPHLTGEVRR